MDASTWISFAFNRTASGAIMVGFQSDHMGSVVRRYPVFVEFNRNDISMARTESAWRQVEEA
jgi:hypothetical protein